MADLDPELVERVVRWCAEAGRQTGLAEIRAALSPLGWDELLNVRALLADPPPARPLGPAALADLARGTPADVAAERERSGRYRPELDEAEASLAAEEEGPGARPAPAPRTRGRKGGPRRPAAPIVHRKRDAPTPAAPPPAAVRPLERLLDPEGRTVLERLIREHGARRSFLLAALGAGWRRADGAAPGDAELDAVLDHHGLARAFAHRERDEMLHALRAARGDRAGAAARVGLAPEAFRQALERLGANEAAERIRDDRRADLRARATLAERCRLVATEGDRLEDLGIRAEFEADLRARLGEHLRALKATGGSLAVAFARSVSLEVEEAAALAGRLGADLGAIGPNPRADAPAGPRPKQLGPRPKQLGPRRGQSSARPARPGARPSRSGPPRATGPRPAGSRPGGRPPRPGQHPSKPRATGGPRTRHGPGGRKGSPGGKPCKGRGRPGR